MESFISWAWQISHAGFDLTELALFLNRLAIGAFFAISGYHKLFLRSRHEGLVATLKEDGIPLVWLFQWLVPIIEFVGGIALILGLFSAFAAAGIFVIMLVALITDGSKRVVEFAPVDKADALDDVLYLSETTYLIMALITILAGPGLWSLHSILI